MSFTEKNYVQPECTLSHLSLWIKASAKCVNVNVKCPVFVSILLFLYLHNISFNYMTEIL